MKFFITLAIAIVLFNATFAGSGTPTNVIFPKSFSALLKEQKSLFEADRAKVCACQILRVASNNENEKLIAVFAQSTNNGELSADFATATSVLEKEKKHMKAFFYTKIKIAENVTAPTPCSTLYKNIQVKYSNVKMYDVLDADALSDKKLVK
ncbi:MAG: hypothetical protein ABIU63_11320 [Chitinophagaceae bacterium]